MVNGRWPQTLHPRRLLQWYDLGGFSLLCKVAEEPVYHGEAIWNAVSQYWPASVTDFYSSDMHASIGLKPNGQAFFRSPWPSLGASSARLVSVKMPSETWKRKTCSGGHGLKPFLTFVTIVFPVARSPQPKTHPVDTAPIPSNARISEEPCSPRGAMMCGAVSILSGETAVERRSACIAYVEPSERRVEQCGALPTSHP